MIIEELQSEKNVLNTLCKDVKQNGIDISRHDMALEDCLDMLEEWEKEKTCEQRQSKRLEQERENLLEILEIYQEQLWNMRIYAEKNDSVWHQQLMLIEKIVQEKMVFSGLRIIDKAGCTINYELHEIIELKDTVDKNKDKTVSVIYRPGYIYQGKVQKKAQVSVYQLKE